jgi:hypothetical protein
VNYFRAGHREVKGLAPSEHAKKALACKVRFLMRSGRMNIGKRTLLTVRQAQDQC